LLIISLNNMVIYMKKRKVVNIVLILIILVALSFGFYFYYKLNKIENNRQEIKNQKELKSLIVKVGHHYLLPSDEEPTVATVSDPELLKEQSFFTQTEKGDKVFIFTKAGKAVLYRPSIDKIIEIVSVSEGLPR